ncbi:MAG: phospholipase D-like domain-containing protein [Methylocystis sp.]
MAFRPSLILALLGLFVLMGFARPAGAGSIEIHYAPVENLERVDLDLLRSARTKINMAAYSLTDWPIVDALIDAHRRGVAVRIVLDPGQQHALDRLREMAGDIRMKARGPYMHLKSYSVDCRVLRSGSANLSASGLKQQDNDALILRDASAVAAFEARFERIWAAATPLPSEGNHLARAGRPLPARSEAAQAPAGCSIKGNISGKGERIYHLPSGRDYNRVTMNGAGKLWFCSEEQALAAGWRKASQ